MFKWNRFLAAVLSASMVFTMAPVRGLAADRSAMSSQEETVTNEAEEENDNGADAGSGADQAVNTDSPQGEDNGTNAESGENAGADDSGKQDADPSDGNDGDDESQSGSDSDAVTTPAEGSSEVVTDEETSGEEDAAEGESSEDETVTTEAGSEGLTEAGTDEKAADSDEILGHRESDWEEAYVEIGDSDTLLEEYAKRMFYGTGSKSGRKAAGAGVGYRLTKASLAAYTKSRSLTAQIADGNESLAIVTVSQSELQNVIGSTEFTAEDLHVANLFSDDSGKLTPEAANALYVSALGFNPDKILDAMMYDCPYEMYWNTGGIRYGMSYNYSATSVVVTGLNVKYLVDSKYRTSNTSDENYLFTADMSKTGIIRAAVNNAGQIVSEASGMSDYYKLNYYREQICDLVEYDHTAADNSETYEDRGPWNLVYVFDNDPNTNVVCEGYSEAFQYLAERTNFNKSSIQVYSVTGDMGGGTGAGGHKWNIVHMDDGRNYMADITNSDSGSIGSDGSLFLKGMEGSVENGYYKTYSSGATITFAYDSSTLGLYNEEELTLSDTPYGVQPPSTADDKAVLKGLSLFLTDKIGMRVYVKPFTDLADTDYIEFSCAGETKQITVANAVHTNITDVDGQSIPVLVFELELWTKQMTDDVTFHMVVDGDDGTSKTYSVRSYADRILAGNYSNKDKTMVRAMLNYGGYAQNYFNYNSDAPANSNIFDGLDDPVQSADPDLSSYAYTLTVAEDTKGFSLKQATLKFGTDIQLVYFYELADGKSNDDFDFELIGSTKTIEFGYDDYYGMNTVTVRHILPYELNQMFPLKVTPVNESEPVTTISYGPFSYCKSKIENGSASIKNLCKSLYYYWDAADKMVNFNNMVTMTVNGQNFTVELLDNSEARAFADMLPLTLSVEFDANTGFGVIPGSINNHADEEEHFELHNGDLILSGSRALYISFINGSFNDPGVFTVIGRFTDISALSSLSNPGTSQVEFSLQ